MTLPDLRTETSTALHRALHALVTEPPTTNYNHNQCLKTWATAKELYALRASWAKDGWLEERTVKDQIEHWYKLLAAAFEPQAA